jgi:hypothetical protein
MLARRFLWVVAGLIVLALIGALLYRLFAADLMKTAMIPTVAFEEVPKPQGVTYADADMWIAHPAIPGNPALWVPAGIASPEEKKASVFFVHPTSYLERSHWNAQIDDEESQERARLFVRSQASAFNAVGDIWAPKYRQATFGAFLTTKEDAERALNFAYGDVLAAFEAFLDQAPKDRPIILAAHSQGSLHLTRLLHERIAGKPEEARIAAAYAIGWPVSMSADLPELGLPACETAEQSGCILSWQSFSEPADPKMVTDVYDATTGLTGAPRAGSPILCVNPLTGNIGDEAEAEANLGTLIPNGDLSDAQLFVPGVPARCDIRGFLLIGENAPDLGTYVLPGNNYHVYDYALFWANIRADVARRLAGFAAQ